MKEFGGVFFLRGPFSFKISVHTCKCTHTHQLKQIQEVCPHFVNSLGLFFFLKVVPRVRMSHWPHNGATVTARPPLSSDSRRMPLWEGFWVALYSLHAEVLTPCVGPLTPHLLSPLMWLYWLWHTEHGDDDQTIKSPPPPKEGPLESQTIPPGFCVARACVFGVHGLCVRVPKMWQYVSGGGRSQAGEIPLTHTTIFPPPPLMNMKQSSPASWHQRRRRTPQTRLSLWLNYQQSGRDQGDHMIARRYCWLITVTQPWTL